eukprot:TRINITY_DN45324_c0_g1_i1.p1 TRINITY_DN45324_c0_g1~~TRINITY_DN45324_c0_g1_i1.p1  ORF type:complete len:196 (+),score=26.35 TRINITY_DN45324_c0_g1_i1:33-620(+)
MAQDQIGGEEMVIDCLVDSARQRATFFGHSYDDIKDWISDKHPTHPLTKHIPKWLPELVQTMLDARKLVNLNAGVRNIKATYRLSEEYSKKLVAIGYLSVDATSFAAPSKTPKPLRMSRRQKRAQEVKLRPRYRKVPDETGEPRKVPANVKEATMEKRDHVQQQHVAQQTRAKARRAAEVEKKRRGSFRRTQAES